MRREYRIDSIEISDGTVFANCYDILYDEPFKKYLGKPESENAILNAQDLLQDETFSISEDVRKEIEEIFSIKALPGVEEAYEENIEKKDTLLEKINEIDRSNNNAYDLKNLYCSCDLNDEDKKLIESYIDSPVRLYKYLSYRLEEEFLNERRSVGDIIFNKEPKRNQLTKSITSKQPSPENIDFQRFPGGKVKVDGKYYPGSIIRVVINDAQVSKEIPYLEYKKNYKNAKILRHIIDNKLLDNTVYVFITDESGEDAFKVKYKEYLTYPGDIKLIKKQDYIKWLEYKKEKQELLDIKKSIPDESDKISFNGKIYDKDKILLVISQVPHSGVETGLVVKETFANIEKAVLNKDVEYFLNEIFTKPAETEGLVSVHPIELQELISKWFNISMQKLFGNKWQKNIKKEELNM